MNLITATIGAMAVSNKKGDTIVTYSLGSCLGLALYDRVYKIGGILHAMLPDNSIVPNDKNRCKFVNSGIVELVNELCRMGATVPNMIADIAGCSHIMDDNNIFKIGERNLKMAKTILQKFSIPIRTEEVGGTASRTIYLEIATGRFTIDMMGQKRVVD